MSVIQEDYVSEAKRVIDSLEKDSRSGKIRLTTNQIRNILSLTAQLYDEAESATSADLTDSLKEKLQYLRVRIVYQAGREDTVKELVTKGRLLEAISDVKNSRTELIRFCRYMEALVAYHRYAGAKD